MNPSRNPTDDKTFIPWNHPVLQWRFQRLPLQTFAYSEESPPQSFSPWSIFDDLPVYDVQSIVFLKHLYQGNSEPLLWNYWIHSMKTPKCPKNSWQLTLETDHRNQFWLGLRLGRWFSRRWLLERLVMWREFEKYSLVKNLLFERKVSPKLFHHLL